MGLDVVMIGLDEIKEQVKTDVQVAAMVKWLRNSFGLLSTKYFWIRFCAAPISFDWRTFFDGQDIVNVSPSMRTTRSSGWA